MIIKYAYTVERLYYGHPWDWPLVAVIQALEHVATCVYVANTHV